MPDMDMRGVALEEDIVDVVVVVWRLLVEFESVIVVW